MKMPTSVIDTGKSLFGMRTYIDNIIPDCQRCFVISGQHKKTGDRGFYAFCKGQENLNTFPHFSFSG